MTPLQFAKANCSNYENNGGCAGIGIKDDLSLYSFGRKPACVLGAKERCRFFEECVLPTLDNTETLAGQQRAREHSEAIRLYAIQHEKLEAPLRKGQRICPQCRKREVEPPKRLCYACAEQNQQKANRER